MFEFLKRYSFRNPVISAPKIPKTKPPKKDVIKQPPKSNVVLLKLITGDLIITKLLFNHNNNIILYNNNLRIMDPLIVCLIPTPKGTQVMFNNWIPLTTTSVYDINPNNVLSYSTPVPSILKEYTNSIDRLNTEDIIVKSIPEEINNDEPSIIDGISMTPYWEYGYGCDDEYEDDN